MSNVIIIGGHGHIALLLEPILVRDGHEVSAIIRKPSQSADVAATGATPVVADIEQLDEQAIADLLHGFDTVIWSAGAGGGDAQRTRAVDQDAAIRTMDAAITANAERFVMVSYFGASRHHGVSPDDSFYDYAEAKSIADEHLRNSSLNWTILGPSRLTFEPGSETIDATSEVPTQVSRATVANVIAETLKLPDTMRHTIRFSDGATHIPEALAAGLR